MSEDDVIMATNDDAAACKRYAVQVGYWVDPYLQYFIKSSDRKAPEINRGYYARVSGIRCLLDQFLKITRYNCQIVNVGAGFDTLYWRLKSEGITVKSFVEVDLPPVTSRKCYLIRTRKPLLTTLATEDDDVQFSNCDLHAGRYHLIGLDIRNTSELDSKLLKGGYLDAKIPTVFLTECVLVYLDVQHSSAFLRWITTNFQNALFINYEQINMEDKFGEVMIENLRKRNCSLAGVSICQSLETQKERFMATNWDGAKAWDMMDVYQSLPAEEIDRIERLEFLDEKELLQQLLQHYCISVAYKGTEPQLMDIEFT